MRFIKRLGIEPKAKEIKLDGWRPRKYYGYDSHQEVEYKLNDLYGEKVGHPEFDDEMIYDYYDERAAAVIIEVSIDPLYDDPDPCQVIENTEMISAINELDYWGDTDDDGVHTVCPRCNYSHSHKDNFCPQCGYSVTMKRSDK